MPRPVTSNHRFMCMPGYSHFSQLIQGALITSGVCVRFFCNVVRFVPVPDVQSQEISHPAAQRRLAALPRSCSENPAPEPTSAKVPFLLKREEKGVGRVANVSLPFERIRLDAKRRRGQPNPSTFARGSLASRRPTRFTFARGSLATPAIPPRPRSPEAPWPSPRDPTPSTFARGSLAIPPRSGKG